MDNISPTNFHSSFYGPRYWSTWLMLGVMKLVALLPLSWASGLGDWLGRGLYHLAPRRRKIAATNIALCFPELNAEEQDQLVRRILRATGINMTETCVALWGRKTALQGRFDFVGLEHIEAAKRNGQGVLLLGAHFTSIDPAAHGMAQLHKFDAVYRRDPNRLFDYKVLQARESVADMGIVRGDIRTLVRRLKQGHMVWYAPDQDYGKKNSVFAPFFGVLASTITATSRIVRMGNAQVLPLAHYRNEKGRYQIVVGPPLENFPTEDDVADATRINAIIEAAVRKHPEQYFWVHRRFKTRPPGEPNLYK